MQYSSTLFKIYIYIHSGETSDVRYEKKNLSFEHEQKESLHKVQADCKNNYILE